MDRKSGISWSFFGSCLCLWMGRRQQAQEQLARTLDAKEKRGGGVGDSENPLATY